MKCPLCSAEMPTVPSRQELGFQKRGRQSVNAVYECAASCDGVVYGKTYYVDTPVTKDKRTGKARRLPR